MMQHLVMWTVHERLAAAEVGEQQPVVLELLGMKVKGLGYLFEGGGVIAESSAVPFIPKSEWIPWRHEEGIRVVQEYIFERELESAETLLVGKVDGGSSSFHIKIN